MSDLKDVSLILARDLASKLSTPMFLVDPEGNLVFYNEPAEAVLGRTFAEAGPLTRDEWATMFAPEDPNRGKVPPDELPLGIALKHRRPAHRPLVITASDGIRRTIEVAAFPLMPHPDQLVGAVAIFWETE